MSKSQREKGKRNERFAAKEVTRVLGIPACRTAQNTGMNGLADIDMGPGFHPEVKVRKSIAACRYYDQAVRDMKPGTIPFVLMREDNGKWMLMVQLDDFPNLAKAFDDARKQSAVQHGDTVPATPDVSDRGDRSCGDART